jgi:hypothetical protein
VSADESVSVLNSQPNVSWGKYVTNFNDGLSLPWYTQVDDAY